MGLLTVEFSAYTMPHPTEERTLPGAVRVKFFGKQLDEIWV